MIAQRALAAVEAEAAPDPLQTKLDVFKRVLKAAADNPEPLTMEDMLDCYDLQASSGHNAPTAAARAEKENDQ